MKFEILCDEQQGLFIAQTEGPIQLEDEELMIMGILAHPQWSSDFNLLFDHTESTLEHLLAIDIQKLSDLIKSYSAELQISKLAMVLSSDLNYGLGRMLEAYTSDYMACEIAITRTRKEAESWLTATVAGQV